jgi:hypothetical protein
MNTKKSTAKRKTVKSKITRNTSTISVSLPEELLPLIRERCARLQVLPNRSQYFCELIYNDLAAGEAAINSTS